MTGRTVSLITSLLLVTWSCSSDDTYSGPPLTGPDRTDTGAASDTGTDAPILDTTPAVDTGGTETGTADTSEPDPSLFGGVAGTVWAPGNAPAMVASGEEIPVSGAVVYLTQTGPERIPDRAYCAACTTLPSRAVVTDSRGAFVLEGFTEGTWWLVVEKAQFRRVAQVEVTAGALTPLPESATTLPSFNDPTVGNSAPRIALAAGSYDHLEDIMGKMGLGDVDADGVYIPMSASGVIDVYENGGRDFGAATVGTLGELVNDLDRMRDYHIIFIPCSGSGYTSELYDQSVLRNLRNYVAEGGNLYVTDWSGEWHDNVFPEQIELGEDFSSGIDTPPEAYDRDRDTWNTSYFGSADGDSYDTPNAEAVDPALRAWLDGQYGPTAHSDTPTSYDASVFEVEGNWNTIESTNSVQVGVDRDGTPIIDEPIVWVRGGSDSSPTPKLPLTVSYEPVGCGRVLFSTYHTTDDQHRGLVPQERVLLYLIMEIGTCRDPKL